jgi:transcriptional regulator with XRE-family HTH domain
MTTSEPYSYGQAVAAVLIELRKAADLSQREVAERAQTGQSNVSRAEHGSRLTLESAALLAPVFGLTLDELHALAQAQQRRVNDGS